MNRAYSVGQINRYIQNMFTQDFLLNKISVKGEVSNCKYHTSGHIYFSLKDAAGTISCVMFAGARKGLAFSMKNGDNVVVKGKVLAQDKAKKVIVFKYKPKKDYRKKQGHRQPYTLVEITSIDGDGTVAVKEEAAGEEAKEEKDYIGGYELDVDRLVFGEILISMPGKTLCTPDCKGLCSICGHNLNVSECGCDRESLDPRMSVFKDILKNFKEV